MPNDVCFIARVYCEPVTGKWGFLINRGTEFYMSRSGFESGDAAELELYDYLPRPYSLHLDHNPDAGLIYGPELSH